MSLFQTLKNYLFSNINKQFLIFLFFLILSASFWLFMTLNDTYEQEIKVPVEIVNVPKNVVMTSTAVDTIRITVRDRGWEIFSYLYGDKISTMRMTFKNYDRGEGEGVIPNAELKRYAKQLLESSSKLISIKPEKLGDF